MWGVARSAMAAALAGLAVVGCGSSYDETAHRTAVERAAGHPVRDWPAYLEAARGACDMDGGTFALFAAMTADQGRLAMVRVDMAHLCPDRTAELDRLGLR